MFDLDELPENDYEVGTYIVNVSNDSVVLSVVVESDDSEDETSLEFLGQLKGTTEKEWKKEAKKLGWSKEIPLEFVYDYDDEEDDDDDENENFEFFESEIDSSEMLYDFKTGYIIVENTLYQVVNEEIIESWSISGCTWDEKLQSAYEEAELDEDINIVCDVDEYYQEDILDEYGKLITAFDIVTSEDDDSYAEYCNDH